MILPCASSPWLVQRSVYVYVEYLALHKIPLHCPPVAQSNRLFGGTMKGSVDRVTLAKMCGSSSRKAQTALDGIQPKWAWKIK